MSYVYFIRASDSGHIKIGKAKDPGKRLGDLQISHPADLELLATTPGGAAKEAELHSKLALFRVRGEWFRDAPEVRAEIEAALNTDQWRRKEAAPLDVSAYCEFRKFSPSAFVGAATYLREHFPRIIREELSGVADRDIAELLGTNTATLRAWMAGADVPTSLHLDRISILVPQMKAMKMVLLGAAETMGLRSFDWDTALAFVKSNPIEILRLVCGQSSVDILEKRWASEGRHDCPALAPGNTCPALAGCHKGQCATLANREAA